MTLARSWAKTKPEVTEAQMRQKAGVITIAGAAILMLVGCGDRANPELMNLRSSGTPDEFAVLPSKPLEMPKDLAQLPTPTPGGTNRSDPTPFADAIIALGGRPQATSTAIPAADQALLARAQSFGQNPNIRADLAADDLKWRQANQGLFLERTFNVNTYYKAYTAQSLNQYSELNHWRSRGVRTPSAPPAVK